MKVNSRGQITIPIELRERFGLNPGTEVDLVANDGALQIRPRNGNPKKSGAFERWLAKAGGSAARGMSTDQIMALTRGEI